MSRQVAVAIVLLALLVRGFVCFRDVDQYSADPDAYRVIAETLAKTGVYGMTSASGKTRATAYRPPLYPYVLSRLVPGGKLSLYAIAALHTLLGCVTVLCIYRASRRLLGEIHSTRASILAASLVIVDPVLLQQSTLVMTETMATAIASLGAMVVGSSCGVVIDDRFGRCSGCAARGCLSVPTNFLGVGGDVNRPALPWQTRMLPKNKTWRVGRAAIVGAIILLAVGFLDRPQLRRIGHPVWATTHGGYTLLLGNNPLFYEYLRSGGFGTTWDAEPFL